MVWESISSRKVPLGSCVFRRRRQEPKAAIETDVYFDIFRFLRIIEEDCPTWLRPRCAWIVWLTPFGLGSMETSRPLTIEDWFYLVSYSNFVLILFLLFSSRCYLLCIVFLVVNYHLCCSNSCGRLISCHRVFSFFKSRFQISPIDIFNGFKKTIREWIYKAVTRHYFWVTHFIAECFTALFSKLVKFRIDAGSMFNKKIYAG